LRVIRFGETALKHLTVVMPALVPGIHVFTTANQEDVDGRALRRAEVASATQAGRAQP
jgi:hypothetical protein